MAASALALALLAGPSQAGESAQTSYRQPDARVTRAFDRAAPPLVEVDPRRRFVLVAHRHAMPSIDRLAARSVSQRSSRLPFRSLRLTDLRDGADVTLHAALPPRLGHPRWSPGGDRFLFTAEQGPEDVALWVGDVQGRVRRLALTGLASGHGHACQWMPGGERLLCVLRVRDPAEPPRPWRGPRVLDTHDPAAPAPATPTGRRTGGVNVERTPVTQLALVDPDSDRVVPVGPPGRVSRAAPSPDGRHLLVWTGVGTDAQRLEVWPARPDARRILSMSREGRRLERWSAAAPATLCWAEASSRRGAGEGDRLLCHRAPFDAAPVERFRVQARITGLKWIGDGGRMLVTEYRADDGNRLGWLVSPAASPPGVLLWSESVDSVYDDPGMPLTSGSGDALIAEHDGYIFLAGSGATPAGSRPFLDRMDLRTRRVQRLWRSRLDRYERVLALVAGDASVVLTSDESSSRPAAYQALRLADGSQLRVTGNDEAPGGAEQAAGFTTQVLHYARQDGVPLSAMLYLPLDREPGERLPLVLEAYPRTFQERAATGEVRSATQRYPVLRRLSTLPLAMQGYAVLRSVAMPVIGAAGTANDSFVEQVVWNARAAVEQVVSMGIADPERVGVVGHSYGAFMVATLLAHSDLFRAGVAASGAYNRTLTPFGFQTERRTLWQAEHTYLQMSPFLAADRINEPLLLLHGARDENPGTPPAQSTQLFEAVRANGGTARLVLLPFEGHVYRARESVLHATAEMIDWFDRYLRAAPREPDRPGLRIAGARPG